jgi:cytochrome subunit of sulfide dehydrogenase
LKTTPAVMAISLALLAGYAQAQTSLLQHPGRLLASGCFQCHGTNGVNGGFDALAGDSRDDMLNKLGEMRRKPARKDIMNPHASGYTNEQLWQIADYFSKLPKP